MKNLLISILLSVFFLTSYCQTWTSASGIQDKIVRSLAVYNADTLLAGVDNDGIYISYDQGENWTQFSLQGESIFSLLCIDRTVIAGSEDNNFFRLSNIQTSWEHIPVSDLTVYNMKLHKDTIFACTWGYSGSNAIYSSADTGKTWNQWGSTLTGAYLDIDFSSNGRTFVATSQGVHYSDYQSDWTKTTGIGGTTRSVQFLGNDSVLYGTDDGNSISVDNGISAIQTNYSEPGIIFYLDNAFYLLWSSLKYTNNINTPWTSLNLNKSVHSLIKIENKLLAGTAEGIYYYENPTNINSISNPSHCNIYPNPVQDFLYIDLPNSETFNFILYNSTGQLITTGNHSPINLQGYMPGLYFYTIKSGNNVYNGRLLLN